MKVSIRCRALDMAGLAAQEAHGKREDKISKKRVIRGTSPLVAGSLDLRRLYDAHIKGAKQNAGAKKTVLHFIVRFAGSKIERQKVMLRQTVNFIHQTHGGDAVFAGRVDLDEMGETIVDVFATPKYEKRTKRTKPDEQGAIWLSATKFGKELAEKHVDEIRRRHPKAKEDSLTSPRMVGIGLNSEFRTFFEKMNGLELAPKTEKVTGAADRLEIEAYKKVRDEEDRANRRMDVAEDQSEKVRAAQETIQIAQDRRALSLERLAGRIIIAVRSLGELLGIVLPKELSDTVDAIEDSLAEIAGQSTSQDLEP